MTPVISTLRLENFQGHPDVTLHFSEGYNCVVGASNVGKTSIVRAVDFVLFGRWDSSWVAKGATTTKVTLTMSSGVVLCREKGDKINRYVIAAPATEPRVYENFGVDLPAEVAELVGFKKIDVDKTESFNLTVSSQLEPLFLFSRSGAVRAKLLGKLTGSHYVDYALRELVKEKNDLARDAAACSAEGQELERVISRYEDFASVEASLDVVRQEVGAIDDACQKIEAVKKLLDVMPALRKRYEEAYAAANLLDDAARCAATIQPQAVSRLASLKELNNKLCSNTHAYDALQASLEALRAADSVARLKLSTLKDELKACPLCGTTFSTAPC